MSRILKMLEPGIYAVAITEDAHKVLIIEDKHHIWIKEKSLEIWPEKKEYDFDPSLFEYSDYDVVEIYSDGRDRRVIEAANPDNTIFVTPKCNSNCIMCPMPEPVRKREHKSEYRKIMEIIDCMPSDLSHITITGGEPFLEKESFFNILEKLKFYCEPSTSFLLLTNGRALSYKPYMDMFERVIPNNTMVGIPIHGSNADIHDKISQSKGSFDQTVRGIKHLLLVKIPVELRIVVSKLNAENLGDLADFISKEIPDVHSVKIMGLEMLGNAALNQSEVWLPYSEAFQKSKECIDKLIENQIDVQLYNFPLCTVDQEYRMICKKSISDYKIKYLDQCDECSLKKICGGIFGGTIRLVEDDIKTQK